jgi:predicted N-formylglutamate amidohydrolase
MIKFFLSCEHGGYQIPDRYQHLFANRQEVLESHKGWDIGALELFNSMKHFPVHFSSYSEISRLLIELNRSLHKRSLFSAFSKNLSEVEKQTILKEYYWPFRSLFVEKIAEVVDYNHEVFHVSVHSFTPVLNGVVRNADIGLLFNPSHGREKEFAVHWNSILSGMFPHLKVRFNYPYLGKTDGHVAPLRQQFGKAYAGIELEMNNKHALNVKVINDIALSYSILMKAIEVE